MIVRNEEQHLVRCLQSIKEIVDEIIIVDTGSTDTTIDIAKSFGARVEHFTWADDFSAARNFALSFAKHDWILSLDADEFIDETGKSIIIDALRKSNKSMGGYALEQRTYLSQSISGARVNPSFGKDIAVAGIPIGSYPACMSFFPVRLFRNGAKFSYRVHEQADPSLRKMNLVIEELPVVIHHLGSLKDAQKMHDKIQHYRTLLLKQIEETPDDVRVIYQMAQLYRDEGNLELAKGHFEKAAQNDPSYKNPYRELGLLMVRQKKPAQAENYFKQAVKEKPNDLSSWNNLAIVFIAQGKLQEAKLIFEQQLQKHPDRTELRRNLDELNKVISRGKA